RERRRLNYMLVFDQAFVRPEQQFDIVRQRWVAVLQFDDDASAWKVRHLRRVRCEVAREYELEPFWVRSSHLQRAPAGDRNRVSGDDRRRLHSRLAVFL